MNTAARPALALPHVLPRDMVPLAERLDGAAIDNQVGAHDLSMIPPLCKAAPRCRCCPTSGLKTGCRSYLT